MGTVGIFAASFVNLRQKPKFKRLVRATGLYEATIKGALQFLWEYGTDVCCDGKLDLDREDVGGVLGLPDDIAQLVFDAMIEVHFVDRDAEGGFVLHDWDENKSPYLKRLESDRARKARFNARNLERSGNVETKLYKPNKPNETIGRDNANEGGGEIQEGGEESNSAEHAANVEAFREKLRGMTASFKL